MGADIEPIALCCEPYTWLADSAEMSCRALERHGVASRDAIRTVAQLCIEHAQRRATELRASASRSGSRWEREECSTWETVARCLADYRERLTADQAA